MGRLLTLVGTLFMLGAPIERLALFMAGGGISSAVMLFYYGTYIPHKPEKG